MIAVPPALTSAGPSDLLDLLTARQRLVYDFIREFIGRRHFPPTLQEIGDRLGIKQSQGVLCHLRALEKKGAIRRDPRCFRGIILVAHPLPTPADVERLRGERDALAEACRRAIGLLATGTFGGVANAKAVLERAVADSQNAETKKVMQAAKPAR